MIMMMMMGGWKREEISIVLFVIWYIVTFLLAGPLPFIQPKKRSSHGKVPGQPIIDLPNSGTCYMGRTTCDGREMQPKPVF
jgi:hypothetical protein